MPSRMWSVPPAEPPATGTLAGSALSAAAKSFALLNGDCAGTTSARYSPVRRAIGVACASLTGLLLARIAPTITMPATISALPCPFHWLRNCGKPTAPPAPPTLVICTPFTAPVARSTCSIVRAVWSQPPPGAAGTKSLSKSIDWASAASMLASDSGKAAAGRSAALRRRSRRVGMAFPFQEIFDDALRRLVACITKAGDVAEVEPLRSGKLARRRASIGPNQMARDWSFVALARLHLLESMGQCADRARQYEQSPAEGWCKAELREDDAGGAIDVHRDGSPFLGRKLRLDRAADGGEASAHRAAGGGGVDQREQARRTRIAGMKAVPKAGNVPGARFGQRLHFSADGLRQLRLADRTAAHARGDGIIKRDALLARSAMHVAEHVDGRGHGIVDANPASDRHPGRRNR